MNVIAVSIKVNKSNFLKDRKMNQKASSLDSSMDSFQGLETPMFTSNRAKLGKMRRKGIERAKQSRRTEKPKPVQQQDETIGQETKGSSRSLLDILGFGIDPRDFF